MLTPDKTSVHKAFCLALNVSVRIRGKKGAAQMCQQPSSPLGVDSSMI